MHSQRLLTMRIIWFALLIACFLYMVIVYVVLTPTAVPSTPQMPYFFGAVAACIAIVSFLMPRMVYSQVARVAKVKTKEEAASSAFPESYRDAMPKRVVFAEPHVAMGKAYVCFMNPFVMSLAFSEAVAVFGFVIAMLGFAWQASLPFFLTGAVLIAIRFPTESTVLRMFEQAQGASFPSDKN